MNKNVIFAAIAFFGIMPFIYVFVNGSAPDEIFSFRGLPVTTIAEQDGTLVVPNEQGNEKGEPMLAKINLAYAEKISGLKPPGNQAYDLNLNSIDAGLRKCNDDGTIPPQANFDLAAQCAPQSYEKHQAERKTALEVDGITRTIMFGASGNNLMRIYHNGVIATYQSIDMTQTDRKRETCIVRIVIDHLIGRPANAEASCLAAK